MIKQNQKVLNKVQVLLDGICILISLILAWIIRFKTGLITVKGGYLPFNQYIRPVIVILPIYLVVYNLFKLYTPRRMKSIFNEFTNLIKANTLGMMILILYLYIIKEINYSRYLLFVFGILNILITTFERLSVRILLRKLRRAGYNIKHIIIVGYSELTQEFIKRINTHHEWGYDVVGILDDNYYEEYKIAYEQVATASINFANAGIVNDSDVEIIGRISELEYYLNKWDIDDVFITLNLKEYDKLGDIIQSCEKCGIRTQIIPDYYKYIPAKPYVEEVDGLPIINTRYVPLDNLLNRAIKRTFDMVVSMICLMIFSPIMLATAITIKLTSPGPIIFKQERVGLNRKKFIMYKFRSMKVQNEEDERKEWTTKNDPRKTKFGNFIRRTSIDELPQLFNVLKGDMSLIGPRPERPYFVEKFKEEIPKYMVKHQVRPGMTGWAQVNGLRGDTSIKKRIEYDIYYIENWDMKFDIKIMWYTVFRGFINKNAY